MFPILNKVSKIIWIHDYAGVQKEGLHVLICIFSEDQKVLNLARVKEMVPD